MADSVFFFLYMEDMNLMKLNSASLEDKSLFIQFFMTEPELYLFGGGLSNLKFNKLNKIYTKIVENINNYINKQTETFIFNYIKYDIALLSRKLRKYTNTYIEKKELIKLQKDLEDRIDNISIKHRNTQHPTYHNGIWKYSHNYYASSDYEA